ncbi:extracellular solute-binding protein [Planctomonas sp. JC2975]|uniref:ABC transporter substrate-binding protein n=1 Tax=Planctomonas sp. JC2975 TaxID=2729626 RepID=UPI001475663D|nr:extracellular solute-binding protein [Planctomonas sp. JC2975]NNC13419.1 extracellular solute-binding protein [Planctomonas sp. JC2975]
MSKTTTPSAFSRRAFLGMAGAGITTIALAACSSSGTGGSAGTMKFWNMPWGGTKFNPLDKKITLAYKPAGGLPSATYQEIQWSNFTQTFASAIASNTGPAVSSGGGTQAFQYAAEGKIAYADDLFSEWKSNGLYDDFLPGLLDAMKTDKGYVAIPYNLDMRILWYNKTLLDKAGTEAPTDWQSYLDAAAALKKIGVYGFSLSSNTSGGNSFQTLTGAMINNGGGLFDEEQKPNCVTQTNIEALDWVVEMIQKGYVDPGNLGYSSTNTNQQWSARTCAMGIDVPGLPQNVTGAVQNELVLGDPLVSASGKKGALYFPNNIMMYKNTPSQKGSEAFLTYYYKHMSQLWTENTGIGLPPLKSIAETSEFKANANAVKLVDVWQPICKTWAAPGGTALFANVSLVDSTAAMTTFAQQIISQKATPKEALTTLQTTLMSQLKK